MRDVATSFFLRAYLFTILMRLSFCFSYHQPPKKNSLGQSELSYAGRKLLHLASNVGHLLQPRVGKGVCLGESLLDFRRKQIRLANLLVYVRHDFVVTPTGVQERPDEPVGVFCRSRKMRVEKVAQPGAYFLCEYFEHAFGKGAVICYMQGKKNISILQQRCKWQT